MPTNKTPISTISDDVSGYGRYNSSKGKTMAKSVHQGLPVRVVKNKILLLTTNSYSNLVQVYVKITSPSAVFDGK